MLCQETKKAPQRACLFGFAVQHVQGLLVNRFTQGFARLEMRDTFFRDLHTFTRARIAANTRRAAIDGEAAKTTDLDAMAFDQGFAHGVQDRFDGEFGVTVRQLLKASSQGFNEVGAGHVRESEMS
jgi:hypothetical protein